jgi:hypothetical protein
MTAAERVARDMYNRIHDPYYEEFMPHTFSDVDGLKMKPRMPTVQHLFK